MFQKISLNLAVLPWVEKSANRRIFTSAACHMKPQPNPLKEQELPVYDYGKVHPEKKRLYVFGCTMHGGLGLDKVLRPRLRRARPMLGLNHPVRHKHAYKFAIADIAAGHGFSLVGIKRKQQNYPFLLGCGLNENSQLGYQAARANAPLEQLIGLVNVSLPVKAYRPQILALAAGRAHSVVSIKGEGLIAWGNNSSGQCGRPIVVKEKYFGSKFAHRIRSFSENPDNQVIKIVSRYDLTVCLTMKGQVYVFGNNMKGQLGRGRNIIKTWDTSTPVAGDIENLKIIDIATNGETVLAVSDEGALFGWGCNEFGLLSSELSRDLSYEPRFVRLPKRIGKVASCSVGEHCTYVVNAQGNVYVWGMGPTLGLGPSQQRVHNPQIMPPPLFGRNEFSPDVKVTKVVGGFYHAAAITSTGEFFTWGINKYGCLGLALDFDILQPFPCRVALGGRTLQAALGVDHTLVVTTGGL